MDGTVVGLGAPCRTQEEDKLFKEALAVLSGKGIEGYHKSRQMHILWAGQTDAHSVSILCCQ